jgi:hypothetical protein
MPPPDAARAAPARAGGDPRIERLGGELDSKNILPTPSRQGLRDALADYHQETDRIFAEAFGAVEHAVEELRQYFLFLETDSEDAPAALRAFGRELLTLEMTVEGAREDFAWCVKRARRALDQFDEFAARPRERAGRE